MSVQPGTVSDTLFRHAPDAAKNLRALYGGVFFVSLAVLLLQIALTRIFSFTLWYHFAYVTISVALLGYGASGALVSVAPTIGGRSGIERLWAFALACGFMIVVALFVSATVPFDPFKAWSERSRQLPYMVIYYVAVTSPFVLAGLCVTLSLRAVADRVSRLYFFDLVGAGVGCLAVVFAIWALTTPGAVVAAATIAGVAGVLFARAAGARAGTAWLGTMLITVLGILVVWSVEFRPSSTKSLAYFLRDPESITIYSRHWTPIFRTDVFGARDEEQSRTQSWASWGISPLWKPKAATHAPKLRWITHDGDANAVMYEFDGDLSKLEMFHHLVLKAPYLLLDRPEVLVIGVGGGTDILAAIANHARHVTGVELDPVTVAQVKETHADFAGRLYDRPDVTMIVGEGRSTVRASPTVYDLIQITGVDTLAALSTGAYVLSESYLYTVEAAGEYLDHLRRNGLLTIVVADFDGTSGTVPRHTLKHLSIFVEALARRGVSDPADRIAVVASAESRPMVAIMVKNGVFTPEESGRLRQFAERMGFRAWALPGTTLPTAASEYLRTPAPDRDAFRARFPLILAATTDDRPFFFNFYRWRQVVGAIADDTLASGQRVLGLIFVFSLVFSLLLIVLPLALFQRRGLRTRGASGFLAFFVAIGLGFIFIEISFVQRFVLFLGYPTYSLTVVLCALLTSSGIGSYFSGRMRRPPEARLVAALGCVIVVSLLEIALLPLLFERFLGAPFPARVLVALAVLFPLGFPLGMFFPTGIQIVRARDSRFVPWAWGVNGCASVVGTVLAVMLAMSVGFRAVAVIALVTYAGGVAALRTSARQ